MRAYGVKAGDRGRILDLIEYAHAKVAVMPGECWWWRGTINVHGYGVISHMGKKILVHRLMFQHYNGPIPHRLQVCHTCDVPHCVNPDHLFLGTTQDNTLDKVSKNRQLSGGRHPMARLDSTTVSDVRNDYSQGVDKQTIQAKYNINRRHLNRLLRGDLWADRPDRVMTNA